ncbi:phage portal protein [Candidatus Pacearchaeota archaeon]|nr:phage portal protein [Candidatus Pacearchaeota archaeon]
MLTDLSFVQNGAHWPPKDADEAARLAEHARMRDIYNGLHERIFARYIAYLADAPRDQKKQAIVLDWPELATDTYLNMLLGEDVEIAAPVEADQLPERPDEQVFIDVSRYGIGLYEVSDSGIQALNPENCYLVVTPGNIQTPWAFAFFHVFKQLDNENKEQEYVKFTIHTKGQIQHVVYEIVETVTKTQGAEAILGNGKTLSGPKKLQDFPAFASLEVDATGIQKPAVDDILIVHVQNQLSSERYYGRSDYKPSVLSLVESLGMLFTQRAEVVAKFTNPTPVIPESATTFDHKTQEWIYRPGQPIITQPGDSSPSLMVWDAQLAQVNNAIEQEMDQLLQMLQLSRVLLAGKDAGTAESGTALRIRLIPTLAKVSKFARMAETAIPKVLHLWSQLPANGPMMDTKDIQVLLQDGIPEDPMETAQEGQLWDAMGAISTERKLEWQGLKEGSEAFDKELARLKGAQEEAQLAAPERPAITLQPMGEEPTG